MIRELVVEVGIRNELAPNVREAFDWLIRTYKPILRSICHKDSVVISKLRKLKRPIDIYILSGINEQDWLAKSQVVADPARNELTRLMQFRITGHPDAVEANSFFLDIRRYHPDFTIALAIRAADYPKPGCIPDTMPDNLLSQDEQRRLRAALAANSQT